MRLARTPNLPIAAGLFLLAALGAWHLWRQPEPTAPAALPVDALAEQGVSPIQVHLAEPTGAIETRTTKSPRVVP